MEQEKQKKEADNATKGETNENNPVNDDKDPINETIIVNDIIDKILDSQDKPEEETKETIIESLQNGLIKNGETKSPGQNEKSEEKIIHNVIEKNENIGEKNEEKKTEEKPETENEVPNESTETNLEKLTDIEAKPLNINSETQESVNSNEVHDNIKNDEQKQFEDSTSTKKDIAEEAKTEQKISEETPLKDVENTMKSDIVTECESQATSLEHDEPIENILENHEKLKESNVGTTFEKIKDENERNEKVNDYKADERDNQTDEIEMDENIKNSQDKINPILNANPKNIKKLENSITDGKKDIDINEKKIDNILAENIDTKKEETENPVIVEEIKEKLTSNVEGSNTSNENDSKIDLSGSETVTIDDKILEPEKIAEVVDEKQNEVSSYEINDDPKATKERETVLQEELESKPQEAIEEVKCELKTYAEIQENPQESSNDELKIEPTTTQTCDNGKKEISEQKIENFKEEKNVEEGIIMHDKREESSQATVQEEKKEKKSKVITQIETFEQTQDTIKVEKKEATENVTKADGEGTKSGSEVSIKVKPQKLTDDEKKEPEFKTENETKVTTQEELKERKKENIEDKTESTEGKIKEPENTTEAIEENKEDAEKEKNEKANVIPETNEGANTTQTTTEKSESSSKEILKNKIETEISKNEHDENEKEIDKILVENILKNENKLHNEREVIEDKIIDKTVQFSESSQTNENAPVVEVSSTDESTSTQNHLSLIAPCPDSSSGNDGTDTTVNCDKDLKDNCETPQVEQVIEKDIEKGLEILITGKINNVQNEELKLNEISNKKNDNEKIIENGKLEEKIDLFTDTISIDFIKEIDNNEDIGVFQKETKINIDKINESNERNDNEVDGENDKALIEKTLDEEVKAKFINEVNRENIKHENNHNTRNDSSEKNKNNIKETKNIDEKTLEKLPENNELNNGNNPEKTPLTTVGLAKEQNLSLDQTKKTLNRPNIAVLIGNFCLFLSVIEYGKKMK